MPSLHLRVVPSDAERLQPGPAPPYAVASNGADIVSFPLTEAPALIRRGAGPLHTQSRALRTRRGSAEPQERGTEPTLHCAPRPLPVHLEENPRERQTRGVYTVQHVSSFAAPEAHDEAEERPPVVAESQSLTPAATTLQQYLTERQRKHVSRGGEAAEMLTAELADARVAPGASQTADATFVDTLAVQAAEDMTKRRNLVVVNRGEPQCGKSDFFVTVADRVLSAVSSAIERALEIHHDEMARQRDDSVLAAPLVPAPPTERRGSAAGVGRQASFVAFEVQEQVLSPRRPSDTQTPRRPGGLTPSRSPRYALLTSESPLAVPPPSDAGSSPDFSSELRARRDARESANHSERRRSRALTVQDPTSAEGRLRFQRRSSVKLRTALAAMMDESQRKADAVEAHSTWRCLQFNGADSILTLPPVPRLDKVMNCFAVDFWFRVSGPVERPDGADAGMTLLHVCEADRSEEGMLLHLGLNFYDTSRDNLRLYIRDAGNRVLEVMVDFGGLAVSEDGEFHHVHLSVSTLDETVVQCRVDGVVHERIQFLQSEHPSLYNDWSKQAVSVGGHRDDLGIVRTPFAGTVVDLRLWQRDPMPSPFHKRQAAASVEYQRLERAAYEAGGFTTTPGDKAKAVVERFGSGASVASLLATQPPEVRPLIPWVRWPLLPDNPSDPSDLAQLVTHPHHNPALPIPAEQKDSAAGVAGLKRPPLATELSPPISPDPAVIPDAHNVAVGSMSAPKLALSPDGFTAVNCGTLADFSAYLQNFSVEVRFRTTVTERPMCLFGATDRQFKKPELSITLNAEPTLGPERYRYQPYHTTFCLVDAHGRPMTAILRGGERSSLCDGAWHTVTWRVHDAELNKMEVKVDGQQADCTPTVREGPRDFVAFSDWFAVAAHHQRGWRCRNHFEGSIGAVSLHARGDPYAEWHFDGGLTSKTIRDHTGHGFHASLYGAAGTEGQEHALQWGPVKTPETEEGSVEREAVEVVRFAKNDVRFAVFATVADLDERTGRATERMANLLKAPGSAAPPGTDDTRTPRKSEAVDYRALPWSVPALAPTPIDRLQRRHAAEPLWYQAPASEFVAADTTKQVRRDVMFALRRFYDALAAGEAPPAHVVVVVCIGDARLALLDLTGPFLPAYSYYCLHMCRWMYPTTTLGSEAKKLQLLNACHTAVDKVLLEATAGPSFARLCCQHRSAAVIAQELEDHSLPPLLASLLYSLLLNAEFGTRLVQSHTTRLLHTEDTAASFAVFQRALLDRTRPLAATMVQKIIRGFLARRRFATLLHDREQRQRRLGDLLRLRRSNETAYLPRATLQALVIAVLDPVAGTQDDEVLPPIERDEHGPSDAVLERIPGLADIVAARVVPECALAPLACDDAVGTAARLLPPLGRSMLNDVVAGLRQQGYAVRLLLNPGRHAIHAALEDLSPEDTNFVYVCGYGTGAVRAPVRYDFEARRVEVAEAHRRQCLVTEAVQALAALVDTAHSEGTAALEAERQAVKERLEKRRRAKSRSGGTTSRPGTSASGRPATSSGRPGTSGGFRSRRGAPVAAQAVVEDPAVTSALAAHAAQRQDLEVAEAQGRVATVARVEEEERAALTQLCAAVALELAQFEQRTVVWHTPKGEARSAGTGGRSTPFMALLPHGVHTSTPHLDDAVPVDDIVARALRVAEPMCGFQCVLAVDLQPCTHGHVTQPYQSVAEVAAPRPPPLGGRKESRAVPVVAPSQGPRLPAVAHGMGLLAGSMGHALPLFYAPRARWVLSWQLRKALMGHTPANNASFLHQEHALLGAVFDLPSEAARDFNTIADYVCTRQRRYTAPEFQARVESVEACLGTEVEYNGDVVPLRAELSTAASRLRFAKSIEGERVVGSVLVAAKAERLQSEVMIETRTALSGLQYVDGAPVHALLVTFFRHPLLPSLEHLDLDALRPQVTSLCEAAVGTTLTLTVHGLRVDFKSPERARLPQAVQSVASRITACTFAAVSLGPTTLRPPDTPGSTMYVPEDVEMLYTARGATTLRKWKSVVKRALLDPQLSPSVRALECRRDGKDDDRRRF